MAVIAAIIALTAPNAWGQVGAIALGALGGILLSRADAPTDHASLPLNVNRATGAIMLAVFFALLMASPLLASATSWQSVKLFESFYRAGSLVFGGGHVVLPLLQASVVPSGWATNDAFLAGYGAAQAVPGPLFTFAAYLGAVMAPPPNGWIGAGICLVAAPEIEGVSKDEGEEKIRETGLPRPSRRVLRTLLRMRKPFTRSPCCPPRFGEAGGERL